MIARRIEKKLQCFHDAHEKKPLLTNPTRQDGKAFTFCGFANYIAFCRNGFYGNKAVQSLFESAQSKKMKS